MKLSRGHSFHTRKEAHQQPLSFTDPHIDKGEDNCWKHSKLPSGTVHSQEVTTSH